MAEVINFQEYCNMRNRDSQNKRHTPLREPARDCHIIYFEKKPASKIFV
ncbi:MAG: hypothetical protein K2P65_12235 [Lachnospiraceae bacterium]|nr:hypothetical protein [Lachnospiraceae bacterium]